MEQQSHAGSAVRIRAVFFLHALASGGLYPRLPDIQAHLKLDDAGLGVVLLGFTCGTISTFFFASPAIERLGTRKVLLAGIPSLAIGTALLGMMPNAAALFAMFLAYGAIYSLINIAMNIEADRVEGVTERRVMNSCHGVWSLGYLGATLLGTLAAGLGLSPALHLSLLVLPVVAGAMFVILPMRAAAPRRHAGGVVRRLALPTASIMLLVGFALGPSLLEGALRNWSVIYMRDSFAAPAWVDTLTLPVFLVAQSSGRLLADGMVMRFGAVRVARVLTGVALAGLVLVVVTPDLELALLGFLLIGFGVCVSYPLTTSAAARLGDRPASQNVASLTLATQIMLLGAPALLGFLSVHFGIRITFATLFPFVVATIWLASRLARQAA